jgi:hypothetical protein
MIQDSHANEHPLNEQDTTSGMNTEEKYERGTAVDVFAVTEEANEKHSGNDIANNDGSIAPTLDNVFHGAEESMEHSAAEGSNMQNYYKRNETDKSDTEEEIDALENKGKE